MYQLEKSSRNIRELVRHLEEMLAIGFIQLSMKIPTNFKMLYSLSSSQHLSSCIEF